MMYSEIFELVLFESCFSTLGDNSIIILARVLLKDDLIYMYGQKFLWRKREVVLNAMVLNTSTELFSFITYKIVDWI